MFFRNRKPPREAYRLPDSFLAKWAEIEAQRDAGLKLLSIVAFQGDLSRETGAWTKKRQEEYADTTDKVLRGAAISSMLAGGVVSLVMVNPFPFVIGAMSSMQVGFVSSVRNRGMDKRFRPVFAALDDLKAKAAAAESDLLNNRAEEMEASPVSAEVLRAYPFLGPAFAAAAVKRTAPQPEPPALKGPGKFNL